MNKQKFLTELEKRLAKLPKDDLQEQLFFYSEMIDDRMEDGIPEEDAVRSIGDVSDIINQILSNTAPTTPTPNTQKSQRKFSAWEITLLILGSPLWLSLLIAAFAILLAVYVVLWSAVISLWAIFVSLITCFLGGSGSAVLFTFRGFSETATIMIGASIFCLGLTIFMFYTCKYATKGVAILTKIITSKFISFFKGKERRK